MLTRFLELLIDDTSFVFFLAPVPTPIATPATKAIDAKAAIKNFFFVVDEDGGASTTLSSSSLSSIGSSVIVSSGGAAFGVSFTKTTTSISLSVAAIVIPFWFAKVKDERLFIYVNVL